MLILLKSCKKTESEYKELDFAQVVSTNSSNIQNEIIATIRNISINYLMQEINWIGRNIL